MKTRSIFFLAATAGLLLASCGAPAPVNENTNILTPVVVPSVNQNNDNSSVTESVFANENTADLLPEEVTPVEGASTLVSYIVAHPEEAVGQEAVISQIEVAGNKYVYVTYTGNDADKKVLLQYSASSDGYSLTPVASFEKGEDTSWVRTSGTNAAANEAREVYTIKADRAEQATSIAPGKNLYTNTQLGFELQYPRSWYYSARSIRDEGGIQRVTFQDRPLDGEPTEQLEVAVFSKSAVDLTGSSTTMVGNLELHVLQETDGTEKYALVDGERVYVSSASLGSAQKAKELLLSLKSK